MKFTSETFHYRILTPDNAAELAQAAFDKWLSEQQEIYCEKKAGFWPWHNVNFQGATNKARLVCIEELAPKVCDEHIPVTRLRDNIRSSTILPGVLGFDYFHKTSWYCQKCGKTLKPNWEVV